MNDLNIAVVSANKRRLDEIERILRLLPRRLQVTVTECAPQRLDVVSSQLSADILILDCQGYDAQALASMEQAGHHPDMPIVVFDHGDSAEFLIQAMRIGVREVLPADAGGASFDAAIERIVAKMGKQHAKSGKVLAFASCKGGSGTTFLATNLGYELASDSKVKVALFDLNLQFGDAALFLSDSKASGTIADVVREIHRLDEAFLKANMVPVRTNFEILSAPEDPALALAIKPEHVDALIALAIRHYDYVILDVGRNLDALTIRALDHADKIFAVIQPTLHFVRGGKRMLEIFQSLEYPANKVELVVNCFQDEGALTIKDLESACGTAIRRAIPHHAEAALAAANQGLPVTKLARSSPIAKSLFAWVADLLGKPPVEEGNWFNRILRRA